MLSFIDVTQNLLRRVWEINQKIKKLKNITSYHTFNILTLNLNTIFKEKTLPKKGNNNLCN